MELKICRNCQLLVEEADGEGHCASLDAPITDYVNMVKRPSSINKDGKCKFYIEKRG